MSIFQTTLNYSVSEYVTYIHQSGPGMVRELANTSYCLVVLSHWQLNKKYTKKSVSVINCAISDHFGQDTVLIKYSPKFETSSIKIKWKVKPVSINCLKKCFNSESWSFLDSLERVDEACKAFNYFAFLI